MDVFLGFIEFLYYDYSKDKKSLFFALASTFPRCSSASRCFLTEGFNLGSGALMGWMHGVA